MQDNHDNINQDLVDNEEAQGNVFERLFKVLTTFGRVIQAKNGNPTHLRRQGKHLWSYHRFGWALQRA